MPQDLPDFVAARDHVIEQVVRFTRTLRAGGVDVPVNASIAAARVLVEVGLDDRDRVAAALHATLVSDPRDSEVFESNFPAFWYGLRSGLEATATVDDVGDRSGSRPGTSTPSADVIDAEPPQSDGSDGDSVGRDDTATGSVSRRIAEREFDAESTGDGDPERRATYSASGEGVDVDDDRVTGPSSNVESLRRFARALASCAGRRWTSTSAGREVDARRVLRESVGTGGVPLSLPERGREPTALRCTVLVDVSQSVLDTIDRGFLLSFLDELVATGRSVRIFFFDTEIQEVTDVFERTSGDPAAALSRAEVAWGGGTRIGSSLETLRARWPDAIDRRTVTLVVSDGLDVGEIDRLEDGVVWLSRRSGAVFWLNPLTASPTYEPTCRGMAAAHPYVDGLFAFAGSEDVTEIARQLDRHGEYGPVGYEHDFRDRRGRERST